MKFVNNVKGAFSSQEVADQGSLVETVLLIAGMAVVAILVVSWIGGAIAGQAANVAGCIAGANGEDITETNDTCTDNNGLSESISNTINDTKGNRF